MKEQLGIGMLPGARRGSVDAVLVNFGGDSLELLHARRRPYPAAIRRTLDQVAESGSPPGAGITDLLDEQLGKFLARVAQDLVRETGLEMHDVAFLGSGGQTAWRSPLAEPAMCVQLDSGTWIARNTGIATVAGFRRADLAAGGLGAPLAPLLHQELFRHQEEDRAVLGIRGIASLTLLPASGAVMAYDAGPGNCLMDAWAMRHLHRPHDGDGAWAARGTVIHALLARMLRDPYFKRPLPKSAGPDYFDMDWLQAMSAGFDGSEADVQATLAELTVQAVARTLPFRPERLLVCGGGAHNRYLLACLATALPDTVVETTAVYDVDPDWMQSLLFAWLARERLANRAQDTSPLTGAAHPVLLGDIFTP